MHISDATSTANLLHLDLYMLYSRATQTAIYTNKSLIKPSATIRKKQQIARHRSDIKFISVIICEYITKSYQNIRKYYCSGVVMMNYILGNKTMRVG